MTDYDALASRRPDPMKEIFTLGRAGARVCRPADAATFSPLLTVLAAEAAEYDLQIHVTLHPTGHAVRWWPATPKEPAGVRTTAAPAPAAAE